jgi:hypothetical protein
MKMLAVLVIVWSNGGAMTSQQIEMPTLAGCKAEAQSMAAAKIPRPQETWFFCVERK